MPIITPERAGEIRGQLTEKYGATWLHHYHEAIEAEVLANAPLIINNNVSTSVGDLMASCREGWRHADELDQERQRLSAVNAQLLDALKDARWRIANLLGPHKAQGLDRATIVKIDAVIAKASEPVVQHLPSDDTEGGAL